MAFKLEKRKLIANLNLCNKLTINTNKYYKTRRLDREISDFKLNYIIFYKIAIKFRTTDVFGIPGYECEVKGF